MRYFSSIFPCFAICLSLLLVLCVPCPASGNNTAIDWFNKGQVYDSFGQIANATHAYEQATRIDPTFAEAWYNLGMDYYAVSDKFPNAADSAYYCFEKYRGHDLRLVGWEGNKLAPMKINRESDWNRWRELHAL